MTPGLGRSWVTAGVGAVLLASVAAGCSGTVERRSSGLEACTLPSGESVGLGESFTADDGCNTCTCTAEGVACTQRGCGTGGSGIGGTGGTGAGGADGGAPGVCVYNGTYYKPGESFPAGDGCNSCSCMPDGSVGCTGMFCGGEGCVYGGRFYGVGEKFPSDDGCNTCFCEAGGLVGCTTMACPPACEWRGQYYAPGASFPAGDGCNTCTCEASGAVACTEMGCVCDPQAEWYRDYVGESPTTCSTIKFTCPENTTAFSNACGCGCEQSSSCPQWFDCMPPAPCNPDEIKRKCPYSGIAS